MALLPGVSGMQVLAQTREGGQGARLVVSCAMPDGPFVADTLARNDAQRDWLARLRLYSQRRLRSDSTTEWLYQASHHEGSR